MKSEKFSERLLAVIESMSLSVNGFAEVSGVSESLLRKYLKGSIPGLDKAWLIAHASGVSLAWLASGEGEMRLEPQEEGEKRLLPYGRRKTDHPFSRPIRRAVDGLLYLEQADPDGFTILSGEILKREEKAREYEDLKKMGNHDA